MMRDDGAVCTRASKIIQNFFQKNDFLQRYKLFNGRHEIGYKYQFYKNNPVSHLEKETIPV